MKMMKRARFWLSAFTAGVVSLFACQAQAQSFPDKPVHIIVGLAPGGGTDFIARALAQHLSALWGQPVIVENRPGAAGAVANEFVAKSPADGYTLLFASDDITALSAFRSDLPYNLIRDLAPVSLVATTPAFLVVRPSLPAKNIKELVALAQSEPGKLTYGSGGIGSFINLQTARFAAMASVDIVQVPYKGSMGGVVGVADGEVDMTFGPPTSIGALTKAGKVRMLAVSTAQRSPLFPTIPTISESGVSGFVFNNWYGMFAPAGVPKDVLAVLNAGIAKVANASEMKAALAKQSATAQTDSAPQFANFVASDLDESVKIVKSAGIKAK